jgi:hypothetical protein
LGIDGAAVSEGWTGQHDARMAHPPDSPAGRQQHFLPQAIAHFCAALPRAAGIPGRPKSVNSSSSETVR